MLTYMYIYVQIYFCPVLFYEIKPTNLFVIGILKGDMKII